MIGDFLRRITAALERSGTPYMLTGSLASSMYGVPRSTNDIDIVIAPSRDQLETFLQLVQRLKLSVAREEAIAAYRNRTMFGVVDFANGWKVDLILQKSRAFSVAEFERRESHEVDGVHLTIATPEDVLLAKLEWAKMSGSERQLEDVAGILRMQGANLDLHYIESWVESLDLAVQWSAARSKSGLTSR
jgi:hypothetical protein